MLSSLTPLLLLSLYALLWLFLHGGLERLKNRKSSKPLESKWEKLCLLIPHRDDEASLFQLLATLAEDEKLASCPIVLIDDHSSQPLKPRLEASKLNENLRIELYQNQGEPGKKGALAYVLPQLTYQYILQLDADVLPDTKLFQELDRSWTKDTELLVAGVRMQPTNNLWSQLAALDHLSLQLSMFATLAQKKPIMASGATMLYAKEAYLRYQAIGSNWQSGEDTFFLQALSRQKIDAIDFNPRAFSVTAAPKNLKALLRQRLRWGAKTRAYPSNFAQALALLVASLNLYVLYFYLFSLITWSLSLYGLALLSLKFIGDYLLLFKYASLTAERNLLRGYLAKAMLYPIYIALVVLMIPFAPKKKWLRV